MRQISYILFTVIAVMISGFFMFKPLPKTWPRELPWFELDSADGPPFTKKNLEGHWTLAYFGYTKCPDLCPATLHLVRDALKILQDKGPHIPGFQVVFVSVDPERDDAKATQTYANFFHPSFFGVSASLVQQQQLLSALDAQVSSDRQKLPKEYLVYHPTGLYLFDPSARWAGRIDDPTTATDIVAALTHFVVASPKPVGF